VQFALELYLGQESGSQAELVIRARRAAAASSPLTFLRSIYLPGDEICFLVFEAPSADAVGQAALDAQIAFERVLEAELVPDNANEVGD